MKKTETNPAAGKLISEYIARAPEYARPICNRLRTLILHADPQIREDWKWGPNFSRNGMICGIWAFQHHVNLTFFRGDALKDPKKLFLFGRENRHNRSIKFRTVDEIDEKILTSYIREAVRVNLSGVPVREKPVQLHPALKRALSRNQKARAFFEKLSFTYRKEYALWIEKAKREETRLRRIQLAIKRLSKGQKFE